MMRLWGILALAAVTGCHSSGGTEPKTQQDAWNALGIRSYAFTYTKSCFCGFTGPNPARVTVSNGVVTKVTSADGATVFNGNIATYPTVDSLFAIAARAKSQKADSYNIAYDETYHFPRVIYVDPIQNATDDEVTYRVESFAPAGNEAVSR